MELYKTVRREAEATQTIEKSKFIAYVKPVESKEEAEAFIAAIRKKHRDATHNVPAMVIGDKFQIQWASDDGEPQGTSGAPMVQMLVKEGVTNVVVVVTRYFGGIKLGTGGLVRAYTSSAKLGLAAAEVCSVQEICSMNVTVDYTYLQKLQNMAAERLSGPDAGQARETGRSVARAGAAGDVSGNAAGLVGSGSDRVGNAGSKAGQETAVKLKKMDSAKAAKDTAAKKHASAGADVHVDANFTARSNANAYPKAHANATPAFLIKDLQYTDKVGFELLALPEDEESIVALLANVTSGSAEVTGRKIILGML